MMPRCLRLLILTSIVPGLCSQFIEPGRVAILANIDPKLLEELEPLLEKQSRTVRQLWNNVPFSSNLQDAITGSSADVTGSSPNEEGDYFHRDELLENGIMAEDANTSVSLACSNDTEAYIMGLVQQQQWALQILDSQGKLPSGILQGNRYWLGSYTECLKASATLNTSDGQHRTLTTQYCTVQIPLGGTGGESPDQQTPGFMSMGLNIGICVPRSCSQDDVTWFLDNAKSRIPLNTSLQISVNCRQSPDLPLDGRAIAAIVICSIIGFFILVGTVYDVCILQIPASMRSADKTSHQTLPDEKTALLNKPSGEAGILNGPPKQGILARCLVAFSIYTNGSKILSTAQSPGSLTCLHGVRFLSMSWVILGHTYAIMLIVSDNLIDYGTIIFKRWTFQAIVNGTFSVDSFFFLSGLLVAYITFKEMDKNKGRINWALFYFHRFWRLTPAYMLVMMVDICLLRYFGDGPIWPQQGLEINYCQDSWWKNLLYINNFFSFYSMCMSWSWYLANDMQFYVISPLVLITLYRSKVAGTAVLLALLTGSFITTGVISSVNKLPPTGNDLNQDFTQPNLYQDLYYEKPYCRIGPYLVGMAVGYILFRTSSKINLNKKVVVLGWLLAITCNLAVLYGLYGHFNTAPLTSDVSALYNTVSRTMWALGLAWLVIACSSGNGGFVNSLLSWAPFQPLGRLTYCAYLIHPLVMLYFATGRDVVPHLSDLNMVYYFLGHIVLSYGLAFVVSIAFEAPMIGLERVLLRGDRKRAGQ